MKQNKTAKKPLYVRVICWILVALMVGGVSYTAIYGIQQLISAMAAG